jgi:multidrug resistance efflux pump
MTATAIERARARLREARHDVNVARMALRKARRIIEAEHRRVAEAEAQLEATEIEETRARRAVDAMTWNRGGTGHSGAHDQRKTKEASR